MNVYALPATRALYATEKQTIAQVSPAQITPHAKIFQTGSFANADQATPAFSVSLNQSNYLYVTLIHV